MKNVFRISFSLLALLLTFACNSGPSSQAKDDSIVVAKVNGKDITNGDLEQFSKGQVYQLKRKIIDALVEKKILEEKAEAAGKSLEDFMQSEIADKVPAPTEDEVRQTYDQAKARGQDLPAFEDIKDEIVRFLTQQRVQGAQRAFIDKAKASATVQVLIEPFRVKVSDKGVSVGPKDAPVTLVEFFDFQCPPCRGFEGEVKKLLAAYPNQVRVLYKDFPLTSIHPYASKAAEAAYCADDQSKYAQMREKLFANQSGEGLSVPSLKKLASELGLDQSKFDECLDSGAKKSLVDEGVDEGMELGVGGTPTFYVNGIAVGRLSPDELKSLIEGELDAKK